MPLRQTLNESNPNLLATALQDIRNGELLSFLINRSTATEAGVVPAANVATLAAQPTAMFQVNATAATVTGIKKLLRGPITGNGAVVPATGECVWDGGTKVLFSTVDAVTAASFTYSTAVTDQASITMRDLAQTGNT